MPPTEFIASGFRFLVYASIGFTTIQIYLTLNRLWKRKHERVVAESISIMGHFVGLVPLTILTTHFALQGEWEGFADGALWIFAGAVTILIGTGAWVEGRRRQGVWSLLASALRTERAEVGDLVRSFFRPSAAERIVEILGQIALVDHVLDERERAFVESFADHWGVDLDWDALGPGPHPDRWDLPELRASVQAYLATSPPEAQVGQLSDVLHLLVRIDERVAPEEALMMGEIQGMFDRYMGGEAPAWAVVLLPQCRQQDEAVRSLAPHAARTPVPGGEAYLVGRHHSRDYAEVVGRRYRALNLFSAVIPLDE